MSGPASLGARRAETALTPCTPTPRSDDQEI